MRVVYFGSGEFAVPSLRWVANSPHELVLVVTQPDRPAGRGKQLHATPVAEQAEKDGLAVERCEDVNDPSFVKRIADLRGDLGIVAAFGQKLLEPLRSAFAHGCVNLHASLLPKYRGAAPINYAILAGEERTGVTVFRLVDRMDAGPILQQRQTMIAPSETTEELHGRLAGIACDATNGTLEMLAENPDCPGAPQDESKVTRAPKLTKADGYIRFDESAEKIALRCRAMWPWPGGRCRYVPAEGKPTEVTLASVSATLVATNEPPGTITEVLTVATGAGTLEIHGIQPADKRCMSWQDFVNGRHVQPQDRFEFIGESDLT